MIQVRKIYRYEKDKVKTFQNVVEKEKWISKLDKWNGNSFNIVMKLCH